MLNIPDKVFCQLKPSTNAGHIPAPKTSRLQIPKVFTSQELSDTLLSLFESDGCLQHAGKMFRFSVENRLLTSSLAIHISKFGINTEKTLKIEFEENVKGPEEKGRVEFDDWVAQVWRLGKANQYHLAALYSGKLALVDSALEHVATFDKSTLLL